MVGGLVALLEVMPQKDVCSATGATLSKSGLLTCQGKLLQLACKKLPTMCLQQHLS